MKKIILVLAVTLVATLSSPFATSAFAKEKEKEKQDDLVVCVCPDGHVCTYTAKEYKKLLKIIKKTGECPDTASA